ncbi:hypothetical protein NL676_026739 [Syzygium grande]|nr:hypothetical protein NL676_026739 [Syzygium grande]
MPGVIQWSLQRPLRGFTRKEGRTSHRKVDIRWETLWAESSWKQQKSAAHILELLIAPMGSPPISSPLRDLLLTRLGPCRVVEAIREDEASIRFSLKFMNTSDSDPPGGSSLLPVA